MGKYIESCLKDFINSNIYLSWVEYHERAYTMTKHIDGVPDVKHPHELASAFIKYNFKQKDVTQLNELLEDNRKIHNECYKKYFKYCFKQITISDYVHSEIDFDLKLRPFYTFDSLYGGEDLSTLLNMCIIIDCFIIYDHVFKGKKLKKKTTDRDEIVKSNNVIDITQFFY